MAESALCQAGTRKWAMLAQAVNKQDGTAHVSTDNSKTSTVNKSNGSKNKASRTKEIQNSKWSAVARCTSNNGKKSKSVTTRQTEPSKTVGNSDFQKATVTVSSEKTKEVTGKERTSKKSDKDNERTTKTSKSGNKTQIADKTGQMTVFEPLNGSQSSSSGKVRVQGQGQGTDIKKYASTNGRPPTTSVLRSAIYYQNRIIIPETKPRSLTKQSIKTSGSTENASESVGRSNATAAQSSSYSISNRTNTSAKYSEHAVSSAVAVSGTTQTVCAGKTHVCEGDTMASRGIDIIVTDTEGGRQQHKVKKKSVWKRISRFLQDNRMRGHPDADQVLAGSNPQDYILLKKVLNIVFLTIGIALLVAVLVVIIYTTIDPS